MKQTFLITLKLVFTVLVAYYLITKIDTAQVAKILHSLSWTGISLAFLTLMLSLVITTYRWIYIAKAATNITLPLKDALSQVFKGFSLSQIMPSAIGGDIYRLIALKPHTKSMEEAISVVFLDRLFGFFSMLVLSFLMTPLFIPVLIKTFMGKLLLLSFILAILGLFALWIFNRFVHISFVRMIVGSLYNILTSKLCVKIIILSLLVTICFVLPSYIFAKDLDLSIGLFEILLIVPLVTLATTLPISFAGWGVREGMMITLLTIFGVPQEASLALSLSCGFLMLVSAIPGALWFLISSIKTYCTSGSA